jgi:hypothetical protein
MATMTPAGPAPRLSASAGAPPRVGVRVDRLPLLALGMIALLSGMGGGLARLGWSVPGLGAGPALQHGPLMVSGFLGTLIGLERAAALRIRWAWGAPVATALGSLAALGGLAAAPALITLGSGILLGVFAVLLRRVPEPFLVTMTLGAASWLVGNLLWAAGWPIFRVVLWWAGFLVLTIAGERQELSRLLIPPRAARLGFMAITAVLLAGMGLSAIDLERGTRVFGAGLVSLGLWLGRYDLAWRTVRERGLARYMALALLSGFAWLAIAGVLAVVSGATVAGPAYDAVLHALFLGFVFAMIFGHAPVIFPGILGVVIPFRARFYVHLVALHATVALRVAGDVLGGGAARRWGGLLNVVTVLLFLGNTATAVRRPRSR